ncbi:MAG TPA: hypothetical protein VFW73_02845, partial [Lacipirellulaceae bacterium]|nr:hypothetical protein [Lacipirellulaceae bacterium]
MTRVISKTDTTHPPTWLSQLEQQLSPGEMVITFFEPDLDGQLHFADSLVVLTSEHILSVDPA